VTNTSSTTTRGETAGSVHSQTVRYNGQTDRATSVLAANKVQVSEQSQISDGESEAIVRRRPSIQMQFRVTFLQAAMIR